MNKSGLFSAIGILAFCLVTITVLNEWDGRLPKDNKEKNTAPLVIAEDVKGKTFTEKGGLEYVINAEELAELDYKNTTELTSPAVKIYDDSNTANWMVTSNKAYYQAPKHQLDLEGDVFAEHYGDEPLEIKSEKITYLSKKERIFTDQDVSIKQGANTTKAGGLEANANDKTIELHSPVESRYVSKP